MFIYFLRSYVHKYILVQFDVLKILRIYYFILYKFLF